MIRLIALLLIAPLSLAAAPAPKAPDAEPAAAKIRRALDDTGDVTLENQSLTDTVTFFKNRMKVDIKIDPTVALMFPEAGGTPITVKAHGKTYRKILKEALEPQQLTFAIVGGTLLIGNEDVVLQKQLRQTVTVDANSTPLNTLLKTLTDDSGANIVLDPRQVAAAEAGRVTLKLDDVPLETAVRLVTEVGGLRTIRMNNVLFITNDARADKLRADADGPVAPGPNLGGLLGGIGGVSVPGVIGAPPVAAPLPAAPGAPPPPATK